jgi:protein TonB
VERITRRNAIAAAATGRIGLALLVSAALHLLFVARVEIGGPRRQDLPPTIHARLSLESPLARQPSFPIRTPVRSSPDPQPLTTSSAPPGEEPVPDPRADPDIAAPAPLESVAESEPIPAPVDPVYYAARELDVYPVPIEPLRVPVDSPARGWVRVLAMVDETGAVTRSEIFDSDPPAILDETALAVIRGARFSPARREGRAVRSRILIELSFEDPRQH